MVYRGPLSRFIYIEYTFPNIITKKAHLDSNPAEGNFILATSYK